MIDTIGWMLVHAAWEGGAIAAAAAVALLGARRARATTRYLIAVAALAMMLVLPIATTLAARSASTPADRAPSLPLRATTNVRPTLPANAPVNAAPRPGVSRPEVVPPAWRSALHRALPVLVVLWLIGVAALSLRTIAGIAQIWRLGHRGIAAVSADVEALTASLAARLRVRARIRVLVSSRVDVCTVVGWLRPAVLIPVSLLASASPADVEMLLAHELAHVRRYDLLVNLVQTIAETLLFFHPAAWWISARIREERESCCDDLAIAVCGCERAAYGMMLVNLEESRAPLALSAAATAGSLRRRVARIVLGRDLPVELGRTWFAGIATMLVVLVVGAPRSAPAAVTVRAALPIAAPALPTVRVAPTPSAAAPTVAHSSTRSTPMSRRSVLTGVAAATIAATGAATNLAAQRPSNFSGHWVSYDSINGQPQDSFTLEYADRRLRIIGDSAAMAFEVDHVDADAKRVQAHGPVALTMSVNGVVYTLDLVHDTTTELRAKWASGGLTVTTGKGPWGLRQYGTVTVWLGDNGDLYLMTEIPSGDQPAKPKVVRYHRG